jgi:hypothetical protein
LLHHWGACYARRGSRQLLQLLLQVCCKLLHLFQAALLCKCLQL